MGCEGLPISIAGGGKCAVVVIDVQNDFCAAGGAFAQEGSDVTRIGEMLPRLHHFLTASRELDVRIVFVRYEYDSACLSEVVATRDRLLAGSRVPCCQPGSWGAEFCSPIEPRSGQPVFTKRYYSAFSSNRFVKFLRQTGIETLVLTGVLTNVCVETTARDAELWGFYAIMLEDCVASDSATLHEASLANFGAYFGWLCRAEDLLRLWGAQGTAKS